jgi:hypothetical protein
MSDPVDVLILGTGNFAARILFDLAATAESLTVAVAGRNRLRLDWLRSAANARAHIFDRQARCTAHPLDLSQDGASEALLGELRPAVTVQAASLQPAAVIAGAGNAWTQLVAEGGLSATAVFQARLSVRVARALALAHPAGRLVNCCFPDVVNGIVAAAGLPIACGIGNIAILAHAFAAALPDLPRGDLKVLAHYQTIAPWRRPPDERSGPLPRVWIGGAEIADVLARFAAVQLTPEPVIDISGASGVPLIRALARGVDWTGHAPGPNGLVGGYPVRCHAGEVELDLPPELNGDEAVSWNAAFEARNGLAIESGQVRYAGRLYDLLRAVSPTLAEGFPICDIDAVYDEMAALRNRLEAQRSLG